MPSETVTLARPQKVITSFFLLPILQTIYCLLGLGYFLRMGTDSFTCITVVNARKNERTQFPFQMNT